MAKYSANPINYGIIPKRWMDTPIMSFEDALLEQERLQNAELANEINSVKAEEGRAQQNARNQAREEYAQMMADRKAKGEKEELTGDDLLKMATKYDVATGDVGSAADREIRKADKGLANELAWERLNKPVYRSISANGGLVEITPDGKERVIREPKSKPDAQDRRKTIEVYDPKTKERDVVGSEAEFEIWKIAHPSGKRISNTITDTNIQKQAMMSELGIGEDNIELTAPEEALAIAEAKKPKEKQKDIVIKPGEKIKQRPDGSRYILKADGSKKDI